MKFTKMTGIGNDYVYIDCRGKSYKNFEKLSIFLSNRNFGVGSDGIILICESLVADFKMRIFNADGSEASMCGNGIRCVSKFVYDKKLISKNSVSIETNSGIKYIDLVIDDGVCTSAVVDMDKPIFESDDFLISGNGMKTSVQNFLGVDYTLNLVSMGNPHAVIVVPSIDDVDVDKVGSYMENLKIFKDRCNIEFIEIVDRENIIMRVYERGSGQTLACGTGACASVVAAFNLNLVDEVCGVSLLGGDLSIKYDQSNMHVFLTGGATSVFEGSIELSEEFI